MSTAETHPGEAVDNVVALPDPRRLARDVPARLEGLEDAVCYLTEVITALEARLAAAQVIAPLADPLPDPEQPWRIERAGELQPGDLVVLEVTVGARAHATDGQGRAVVDLMVSVGDEPSFREITLARDARVMVASPTAPASAFDRRAAE